MNARGAEELGTHVVMELCRPASAQHTKSHVQASPVTQLTADGQDHVTSANRKCSKLWALGLGWQLSLRMLGCGQ